MAENADGQEKTEAATPKRLAEAREKGQTGKSMDVTSASVLLFGGVSVYFFGPPLTQSLTKMLRTLFIEAGTIHLTEASIPVYFQGLMLFLVALIFPIISVIAAVGFIAEVSQVGFQFSTKKFTELNFGKLFNPLPGLKRIAFSSQAMVEMLKGIVKITIIGSIVYSVLHNKIEHILELLSLPFQEIGLYMTDLSFELLYKVGVAYALIAAGDFYWQRHKFKKDMKMTKQEVKEETKQSEGDMMMKLRFRAIGRDRIRKMMLQRVKEADVVITNPTHYAVALQYKPGKMDAPKVVAKGVDHLARKIKEIAGQAGVPIVEDKPLARALYKMVDIDQSVPESLFRAVAQVLAYVYKLKKKAM